jgi:hypothetical protein
MGACFLPLQCSHIGSGNKHRLNVDVIYLEQEALQSPRFREGLRALQSEGDGLFAARTLGVDGISFQPHVLIAEATPSDLSCC